MSTNVQFRQETYCLPIFPLKPADPNPALPSQGHRILYPYTRQYDFGREPVERDLDGLVLENNRMKVQVLPALGGRVWETLNKASGLPLFHTPERVGLINFAIRGAWYTGGVEFNFPNGHTVSANETVPALVRRHPSGAASILIGNLDLVWRVTWQVGIRLEPDSSSLHFDVLLNNRTSLPVRYMWWINAGVTAEASLEYVNRTTAVLNHFLGRRDHLGEDVAWPIHQGQDLRWYRNYLEPTSLFHLAGDDRWFGFYSHQLDQGVVRVGNSAEAPGLKFWNSGQAEEGYLWGTYMTAGRRYANSELQSGRPETQTDYGTLPPHYVLRWSETWRPVWGLGGVDCASESIALSLRDTEHGSVLKLLGDRPYLGCLVRIRKPEQADIPVDIPADGPLSLNLPYPTSAEPFGIEVIRSDGERLIEFNPSTDGRRRSILADVLLAEQRAQKQVSQMSAEELGLEALRLERSNYPQAARDLAEKALRIDPGHTVSHLLLARLDLRQGDTAGAYERCRLALERDPQQEWAHYLLALSQLWAGHPDQALIEFERAAGRSYSSASACWYHLGELYLRAGRWGEAIAAFERCLTHEAHHVKALVLKATALRHSGQWPEAEGPSLVAARNLAPLDPLVRAETWLCTDRKGNPWSAIANDQLYDFRSSEILAQDALEAAFDYTACNLLDDAKDLLQATLDHFNISEPLAWYTLGYLKYRQGDTEGAQSDWEHASRHSGKYVYAFRREEGHVLAALLEAHPDDGLAQTLLGMLDVSCRNYERAIPALQRGAPLRPTWDVPLRLMGICHQQLGQMDEAVAAYQQALATNPDNPRLYVELDELLTELPGREETRTQLWANPPAGVLQDEPAIGRYALALASNGRLDEALDALGRHVFFPEEGSSQFRDLFSQIHLLKGIKTLKAGNLDLAFQYAETAATYPPDLGLATPFIRYDSGAYLLQATIKIKGGDAQKAAQLLELAAGERHRETNEAEYYSGLALRWLKREDDAQEKFRHLLAYSQVELERPERDSQYARLLGALGQAGLAGKEISNQRIELDFPRYRWLATCTNQITQAFDQAQNG